MGTTFSNLAEIMLKVFRYERTIERDIQLDHFLDLDPIEIDHGVKNRKNFTSDIR